MADRKGLGNTRLIAAISIGVFLAGLGVGYGVFLATTMQQTTSSQTQLQQQWQLTTAAQSQTLMAQGYRLMTQGANTMLQGQEMINQGKVEQGYVTMLEGSSTMEQGRNMMGQGFDGFKQMQGVPTAGMMGGGGMMQGYNSMMSSMSAAMSNADSMMDARNTMMSGADMARKGDSSEGMEMMSRGAGSMTVAMEMMRQNMMSGTPAPNAGTMMNSGMMQQMMGSMMGNVYTISGPLTFDNVKKEAANFVSSLNNPDLAVRDVMEFQYNYYFIVYEKSTGTGAFEMIVMKGGNTQGTGMMMSGMAGVVHPEPGPNMMWNTKYGMMTGLSSASQSVKSQDLPISSDRAKQIAQQYLDNYVPGDRAEDVETFYGYYTIHAERDGKITGMLSVNGFSGQVWFHSWHGEFIMSEEEHE